MSRSHRQTRARFQDFGIGIGFAEAIADAQRVALKVLDEHPAVDGLGKATVNLRLLLAGWQQAQLAQVRSSVIRSVKRALGRPSSGVDPNSPPAVAARPEDEDVSARAEAGLHTEARDIEAQAQGARVPEGGENLLGDGSAA